MQTFEAVGIQGDNGQMRALDLFKGQHFNSEVRAHYVIAKDRQCGSIVDSVLQESDDVSLPPEDVNDPLLVGRREAGEKRRSRVEILRSRRRVDPHVWPRGRQHGVAGHRRRRAADRLLECRQFTHGARSQPASGNRRSTGYRRQSRTLAAPAAH